MIARRQAVGLQPPDEQVRGRTAVAAGGAGCREAPAFGQPGRQRLRDQHPRRHL